MAKKDQEENGAKKTKKGGKIFLRVLGVLVLAFVLLIGTLLVIPAFEYIGMEHDLHITDWMRDIPDGKKLSEVRIPGAHDAATENVELAFAARCQQMSIKKLLESGFRYLDIRLAVETQKDGTQKLRFMHGPTKCKTGFWPWEANLYLDDVLADCYDFLRDHPGETILFVVKQESGSESVQDFQTVLNRYVSENKDKWLLTDSEIPTMGEARGKLVLFRRYDDQAGLGADAGIPLIWTDQGNKDHTELNYAIETKNFYTLAVQDRYKYGNDDKWAAFTAKPSEKTDVTISFLSTAGGFVIGHPYAHAKVLDAKLMALPVDKIPEGWVIIDFGNVHLARKIIDAN